MSWSHEAYAAGITILVVGCFPEDGSYTGLFIDDSAGNEWTLITEITGQTTVGPWSTWQLWWTTHAAGSNSFNPVVWGNPGVGDPGPLPQQAEWLISQDQASEVVEMVQELGASPLSIAPGLYESAMMLTLMMGPAVASDYRVSNLDEVSGQRLAQVQGELTVDTEGGNIVGAFFEMNFPDATFEFIWSEGNDAWAVALSLPQGTP